MTLLVPIQKNSHVKYENENFPVPLTWRHQNMETMETEQRNTTDLVVDFDIDRGSWTIGRTYRKKCSRTENSDLKCKRNNKISRC